jgi:hypothetical protein
VWLPSALIATPPEKAEMHHCTFYSLDKMIRLLKIGCCGVIVELFDIVSRLRDDLMLSLL